MRKFYWKDMFAKNDPDKLIRAIESALSGDEIYDADSGSDGMSLFEAAVRWGNAETVKACITKGADADYRDIEKMSADSRDFENSALWAAISERNTDTLKALLGAGANVRVVKKINWDLRTNVFPEAETDNPSLETLEYKRYLDSGEEILKILKEHGVGVPYDSRMEMKPTFIAIGGDSILGPGVVRDIEALCGAVSPRALKLRLAAGADVNERDGENWTALHYIAQGNYFGRDAMIEILLAAGADIDAKGGFGSDVTPLMLVAARVRDDARYLETVKLLLKNGANFKAKTKGNETVQWWATSELLNAKPREQKLILREIIEELGRAFGRSAKKKSSSRREVDVDLMAAAFWARPEKLAEILSRGADVNVRSKNGYTPLMFASTYNRAAAVKFLIESGADPNARGKKGDTPLLLAAGTYDANIIKVLIEGGADPCAEYARGNLPLNRLSSGIMKKYSYEAAHVLLDAMAERGGDKEEYDLPDFESDEEVYEHAKKKPARRISKAGKNFLRHGLSFEKDTEEGYINYDSLFRLNDEESLIRAVKNGLNVEFRLEGGWYFFEAAVKNNAMGVLRACIEMGADVNDNRWSGGGGHWLNPARDTTLGVAVTYGNPEAVEILIENGLNTDFLESVRMQFAYRKNDFPEGRDKKDKLARKFKLILDRNAEILSLLRGAGFDIPGEGLDMTFTEIEIRDNSWDIGDGDVLALVRAVSPLALKKAIDSGINVNAVDESQGGHRRTALHHLISLDSVIFDPLGKYYNQRDMIKLMLASGADVNAADAEGATPLTRILQLREGESVLDLLTAVIASGADFEKTTEEGKSALDMLRDEFRRAGNKYKIRVFDEFCCEIERVFGRKSNAGERARANTHLMMAARWGNAAQIKLALAEADVNAGSESGFTPLMFTAFNDKPESVKCLVGEGADLEAKNVAGETALIVAARCGESAGNIEALISAGANANAADNEGYTALMRICERAGEWHMYAENYSEDIRALIDAGANVNARNAEGQTALMMAANEFHGETKISKILVKAGADVNARDNLERTALGFARRNRCLDIERFLISAGARTDQAGPDENYFPDAVLKLRDCGVEF